MPTHDASRGGQERRQNLALRELLDEMLTLTRDVARRARTMSPRELEHAQERLDWLADEIYGAAVDGAPH